MPTVKFIITWSLQTGTKWTIFGSSSQKATALFSVTRNVSVVSVEWGPEDLCSQSCGLLDLVLLTGNYEVSFKICLDRYNSLIIIKVSCIFESCPLAPLTFVGVMSSTMRRWMSVSDVCLTYLTFPQSYHTVMETVWHWAPLRPGEPPRERKRQLYMETLTYREVDNLNRILVDKMRWGGEESQLFIVLISLGPSVRLSKEMGRQIWTCRLHTIQHSGDIHWTPPSGWMVLNKLRIESIIVYLL